MKIIMLFFMCFSVISYASSNNQQDVSSTSMNPNKMLLPSPFPVYILENNGVINHPYPGAIPAALPTDNSYTDAPGCYIACYSHFKGVYPVAPSIYVMGQIRVKGQYLDRICQPEGYVNRDISAADSFKQLCSQKIASCKEIECWAGGDTGGWFGIQ
ncbi:hypothetical protein [Legionella cardiaca]|uniref:Uncharacterized protein n=1 Tax=Legionella cardiaca TaxID=1071983 RepID=A0ABY8AZN5_9GAMM|nr:hypothetical protein [Legionella cardiaca]WED44557.1 hypothetical protein PXX05_07155 [Legionella cardiaca]